MEGTSDIEETRAGRRYQELQAMLQNKIRAPFYMGEWGDEKHLADDAARCFFVIAADRSQRFAQPSVQRRCA